MNPEVKKLWVKALRSGKYKQGTGVLHRTDDRFCCLGVLCEVAIKQGVQLSTKIDEDLGFYYYDDADAVLPEKVQKWAELEVANPDVYIRQPPYSFGNVLTSLAELNDDRFSFEEIAKVIEDQL